MSIVYDNYLLTQALIEEKHNTNAETYHPRLLVALAQLRSDLYSSPTSNTRSSHVEYKTSSMGPFPLHDHLTTWRLERKKTAVFAIARRCSSTTSHQFQIVKDHREADRQMIGVQQSVKLGVHLMKINRDTMQL